jgi:hypothetical protein
VKRNQKKIRYANPILHVVRKRVTVLAVQLESDESIDTMAGLYLNVVNPNNFGDDDSFQLLKFDTHMGVLWFQPTEKPLEMVVGDWLVYDGDDLYVVSDSKFKTDYHITIRGNKKERDVRVKESRSRKLNRVRSEEDEYRRWDQW